MKKDKIAGGLNGLLTKPAPNEEQATETPKKKTGNYKTVCYSISPEVAEKIAYIAYYDRRRLNAVVTEAFEAYIKNWKPAPQEKPRKL